MVTDVDINRIANLWILLCNENETAISPLKLQKLLYYTQAWHWVYFDSADIFTELPQAWVNGPVYPDIYERFKAIGIYDKLTISNTKIEKSLTDCIQDVNLDTEQQQFFYALYKHYGLMSNNKLVFLTHSEAPWCVAREGLSPFEPSQNIITKDIIEGYYSERLKRKRTANGNL